jgi:uncharacterized membrane protein
MAWAIIATLLFWPLGVPAIMNAARVHKQWAGGDALGAVQASTRARRFAAAGTAIGVLLVTVALLLAN